MGFPGGTGVKNLPANAGDGGLIPASGRSPGGANGYPLQYSWLKNLMAGYNLWGHEESDMTEWLSTPHVGVVFFI